MTRPVELKSEFLMRMEIDLGDSYFLGDTPHGGRRIDVFDGGRFAGPRLKGTILPGGSDLLMARPDSATQPDVRLILKTDDDALILVTYRGVRHAAPDVMNRIAAEELVEPSEYYLRNTPYFETGSEKYGWLNRIVAVATGSRRATGPSYRVYEIL